MQKAITDERNRIIAVLTVAALVGHTLEQLPWVLAIASVGLTAYSAWQGARLLQWLEGDSKLPLLDSGIWAEIYSQLQRERHSSDKRHRKLREVLRWYSDSADALPDAALILDKDHVIIGSNQAARHTLGIDNKRDRGQRVDNLLRDPLLLALLNGELPDSVVKIDSPANPGHTLRLRLTAYGAGKQLILAQDISEQIHNQEMRQAFVANVSHELHTPLTVVNGHLELLLEDPDLNDAQLQQLQQMSKQSHRMQMLVQDLLSLARLESAPLLAKGQLVPMSQLIESAISALCSSQQYAEHKTSLSLDQSLLLHGRPTELESIIHNLIGNALRHTPAGTHIEIEWALLGDGRPALRVSDNGAGIPAEHLPHLTERFYRADPSRSGETGGTGLGLAIVKHALQHHGGELRINSNEGRGSEFIAVFSTERAAKQLPEAV